MLLDASFSGVHSPCSEIGASPAFCNIWEISSLLLVWLWHFKWLLRGTCWMLCRRVPRWEHTEVCSLDYLGDSQLGDYNWGLEGVPSPWFGSFMVHLRLCSVPQCIWSQDYWARPKICWGKFSVAKERIEIMKLNKPSPPPLKRNPHPSKMSSTPKCADQFSLEHVSTLEIQEKPPKMGVIRVCKDLEILSCAALLPVI